MITKEFPHYTKEQVAQHLADALEIVDASDCPPDLVPIVLPGIIDKLAAKQIVMEQHGLNGAVALPPHLR